MENYNHTVSGIYPNFEEAKATLTLLHTQGLASTQLNIIQSNNAAAALQQHTKSDNVLNDVIVDGAVGTVVGAGAFGLGHLALVWANISLFVASPLLGPLIMLGWGASVGGLFGAIAGATVVSEEDSKGKSFIHLVEDAISRGYVVLVAQTMTEQETLLAQEIIRDSVNHQSHVVTI
ncbi:hypothetical protein FK216_02375 [Moraxellaceae bacterium AER2_44_116]|nr:hypothetical protein [Moraxellaceae bacterium]TQD00107.1 hypothetical protein FK216_02375 [Moraxellaceae bacterium AER2_44_116]